MFSLMQDNANYPLPITGLPKNMFKGFRPSKEELKISSLIKIAPSLFYRRDIYESLVAAIRHVQPDVVYVLSYGVKLTHAIFDACFDTKTPVVHRISDFTHFCLNSSFFRNGQVCTKCISNRVNGVIHRCANDSFGKSLYYYSFFSIERVKSIFPRLNAIVVPSMHTAKFFENSYPSNSIHVIPSPRTDHQRQNPSINSFDIVRTRHARKRFIYSGRVVVEKGVLESVMAFHAATVRGSNALFEIYGMNDSDYSKSIKEYIVNNRLDKQVICHKFDSSFSPSEVYNDAYFSVIPSLWFDNLPNTLIESLSLGVPIICTSAGSLGEHAHDGTTGFKYETNEQLSDMFLRAESLDLEEYIKLCSRARDYAVDKFNPQSHINALEEVFQQVCKTSHS